MSDRTIDFPVKWQQDDRAMIVPVVSMLLATAAGLWAAFGLLSRPEYDLYGMIPILVGTIVLVLGLIGGCFYAYVIGHYFARWEADGCKVTKTKKFISLHTESLQYGRIVSVELERSLLGRWWDYGTITLRLAGQSTSWTLPNVSHPEALKAHFEQVATRNSQMQPSIGSDT